MTERPAVGTIGWLDLTVEDADRVRDFYTAVVGWTVQPVEMGEYSDYAMVTPGGDGVAGVCHKRGSNASMPGAWLPYFVVADLDAALAACGDRGGEVVVAARAMPNGDRYAVIRDPSGAVAAVYEVSGDGGSG